MINFGDYRKLCEANFLYSTASQLILNDYD